MRGLARSLCAYGLMGLGAMALAQPVRAADEASEEGEEPSATEGESAEPSESAEPKEDSSGEATDSGGAEASAATGAKPTELLIGARYRGVIFPQFVWGLFADGGKGMYVHGAGPELAIRSEGHEINLSAWLAFYGMDPSGFKGKSDAEEAWEILELDLKVLYLTSDFLWRTPLSSKLDLSYGIGVGIGIVFGDMLRNQAYLSAGGTEGNADDYAPCAAPLLPSGRYCDTKNGHYNDYSEKSWFGGGPKPSLLPWISGQIGLQYRVHEKFLARVEAGVGTSAFFFGIGGDYAL